MERRERRKFSTNKVKAGVQRSHRFISPKGNLSKVEKLLKDLLINQHLLKGYIIIVNNPLIKKALECHGFDVRQKEVQESSFEDL